MTITRHCKKCDTIKSLDEFVTDKRKKYGKGYICKECARKRNLIYFGTKIGKERRKEITQKCREKTKEHTLWYHAKTRALSNNIIFDITPNDIIIPDICPVLAIPICRNIRGKVEDYSPSLDRVNPNRGYIKENILVISHKANRIKHSGTIQEHKSILVYMKNYKSIMMECREYFNSEDYREKIYCMLRSSRGRAKKYNLSHNITFEDIKIPKTCPVFGTTIQMDSIISPSFGSPTLDRIDSNGGYTRENILVISHRANTIKNNGCIEEHQKVIEYMEKYSTTCND